ncbi:MAG: aspartoacylase [Epsilonproteobacteria bacterium]|nr:aspartoacylase [Campylobacterota bacterium]NPA65158.1 aspartoacylase [Campylobacterota bacterium]
MRVSISGGVHGNELLGIYLVKDLLRHRPSIDLDLDLFLANPKAIEACRRYIDYDLNRSFGPIAAKEDRYEFERAKKIKNHLAKSDFLIDLHTTTANMGISVILSSQDALSQNVAKILAAEFEEVRIVRWFGTEEGEFINSCVPSSITLECGPVCQGLLDARLYFQAKKVLLRALEILQKGQRADFELECYDIVEYVDFPRRDGELFGMIHPHLLGRDFSYLRQGDPIFVTFDHKEITSQKEGYAVFINEAAYYEKKIAFCLTKKDRI